MDDMKREMYIRAKKRIASGETDFICWALLRELSDTFNIEWNCGMFLIQGQEPIIHREIDGLLEELFPEFFELFDGVFWPLGIPTDLDGVNPVTIPHAAWFGWNDRERRQRLLDFLITHR